jgi:pSer/pThr/pTyr-binding forkhead associated (FHA) protein
MKRITTNFVLKTVFANNIISSLTLDLQEYRIGRNDFCDVCITEKFISRFHCTLILLPPEEPDFAYKYLLWDGIPMQQRSTGGTWVNGRRINSKILKSGDVINFSEFKEYPHLVFESKEIREDGTLNHIREESSNQVECCRAY